MSAVLARIGTAMTEPTHGTQACFRAALDALSRPGRIQALPWVATAGLQVPAARPGEVPMSEATAALLLTLLDAECSVRLHGSLASESAQAWLRFHTGVREALPGESAAFTVVRAAELSPAQWEAIDLGSDEAPQRGGTLIVEVPVLAGPDDERYVGRDTRVSVLRLRGPGIENEHSLLVGGVPQAFWRHRIAAQPRFPQGFEIFLTGGRWLAALPRTARIELDA